MTYFLLTFLPAVARLVIWGILGLCLYLSIAEPRCLIVAGIWLWAGWRDVYGPGFRAAWRVVRGAPKP